MRHLMHRPTPGCETKQQTTPLLDLCRIPMRVNWHQILIFGVLVMIFALSCRVSQLNAEVDDINKRCDEFITRPFFNVLFAETFQEYLRSSGD